MSMKKKSGDDLKRDLLTTVLFLVFVILLSFPIFLFGDYFSHYDAKAFSIVILPILGVALSVSAKFLAKKILGGDN